MGTNFYLVAPEYDDLNDPGLHIGKSSAGWEFTWQAHPHLGIRGFEDWERLFAEHPYSIVDEYGETHTTGGFYDQVMAKRKDRQHDPHGSGYRDGRGHWFVEAEFC